MLKTGCSYRDLPEIYPPRASMHRYKTLLEASAPLDGLVAELLAAARRKLGRPPEPSVAVLDSQSLKADCGAEHRGYDGNKKILGTKDHLATDASGLPLDWLLLPGNTHDQRAAYTLVEGLLEKHPAIKIIYADSAYEGKFQKWCEKEYGVQVIISKKITGEGFEVIPRRWVVERTFAWSGTYRQLIRNHYKRLSALHFWIKLRTFVLLAKRVLD